MTRHAALLVVLNTACGVSFVPPALPAFSSSRTRPRGASSANLLPGIGSDTLGGSENQIDVTASLSNLPQVSSLLHALDLNAAGDSAIGGGMSAVTLIATEAPGDAYLATGLFGIAAAAIAVGAGALVLSNVSGKDGLGQFLSQEKGNNPFYKDTMTKLIPKTPEVFNKIRFPDLDFVEVYNQPPSMDEYVDEGDTSFDSVDGGPADESTVATAEGLRQRLLMAVQAKDYELASSLERELASFLRKTGLDFEGDGK